MTYSEAIARLYDAGKREIVLSASACGIIGVLSFILAMAAGAFVRIYLPFSPVPITLQTFFVLLSGAMLGRRLGPVSQAGYLTIGSLGLPIFAGAAAGFAYLLGPTGGYLLGFVLASALVGWIIRLETEATFTWAVFAMTAGSVLIYLLGAGWLAFVMKVSFVKALSLGVLPFIPGDILKILSAAAVFTVLQKRVRQIFSK